MDHLREHSPRQGKVFFLLLYPRKLLKVEYDLSSDFPLHWFTCTVFSFADVPVAKTGDIYRVSLFFAFYLKSMLNDARKFHIFEYAPL